MEGGTERNEREREREDSKKRKIKRDTETTSQSENERGRTEAEHSSCKARRGQQDWKRPMLDRDQLLSPTCLVDSQIIARSLHGPRMCALTSLSVRNDRECSVSKDKVKNHTSDFTRECP
jgi:hypothetical protein